MTENRLSNLIKVPKMAKNRCLLQDTSASDIPKTSAKLKLKRYVSPLSWKKQIKDLDEVSRIVDHDEAISLIKEGSSWECSPAGMHVCESSRGIENAPDLRFINKENKIDVDAAFKESGCEPDGERESESLQISVGALNESKALIASTPRLTGRLPGRQSRRNKYSQSRLKRTVARANQFCVSSFTGNTPKLPRSFAMDVPIVENVSASTANIITKITKSPIDEKGVLETTVSLEHVNTRDPIVTINLDMTNEPDLKKESKVIEVVDLSCTVGATDNQIDSGCGFGQNETILLLDDEEFSREAHQLNTSEDVIILKETSKLDKKIDIIVLDDVSLQSDDGLAYCKNIGGNPSGILNQMSTASLLNIRKKREQHIAANKSRQLLNKAKKVSNSSKSEKEDITFLSCSPSKKTGRSKIIKVHNSLANYPRLAKLSLTDARESREAGTGVKTVKRSIRWDRQGLAENRKRKLQPSANIGRNIYGNNFDNPMGNNCPRKGLRPVVIDGSNVAMGHGKTENVFSSKGLNICVQFFLKKGHKVYCFVPLFRKSDKNTRDAHILEDLENQGHLICTPSRYIKGRTIVPYDDRYIVQTAAELGGVIVSRDNFRDLVRENPHFKDIIQKRLLMYTWVADIIMFPQDPLGRNGPNLDEFLQF